MLTPSQPGADKTNTEPNKPTTSNKLNASREQIDSGAPRHRPSVFDLQPDDLSTAGSCATALARRHRTDSLGRVEVADRDDMPLGLHDPRAQARRTEAVLDPSAVDVVHEAAGQRDAVSRAVARDNPATSVAIPAIMADVEEIEVVVAHSERATLRVGDVFLKMNADHTP